MGKRVKRDDLLDYAYFVLYDNWPKINKKLGLDIEAFLAPTIKFIKGTSEYSSVTPDFININYITALDAYKKKNVLMQGLEVKCEDLLKDDVIHECVHYIQNEFYNLDDDDCNYATEGLASLVTVEIHLINEDYKIAAASIADYFIETKRKYKDYFGLPKEYNKHIEKIIKDGTYKPVNRDLAYAKGFMHICDYLGRPSKNYLHILIEPFKNSEVEY